MVVGKMSHDELCRCQKMQSGRNVKVKEWEGKDILRFHAAEKNELL